MKKYLLSLLLVAALVASFIVPTLGDGESEDNFKGDASLYVLHADGSKYDGQSKELNSFLENGYLYIQTKVNIESANRVSGTETLELQATEGNLDNIESIEYTEKGSEWADAYSYVVNTNHNFTDKFSIERNYRIKITGPVKFCLKYKVFTPEGVDDYASFPRYVFITESQGGTLDSLTYFEKPTTTAPTTTTEETTTTTVAPTTTTEKQSTTVAPTTTVGPTDPTSTVEPTTVEPTTVEPTTVEPSSEATTVAPTKGQKAKTPGKAKIKKVWKKKKSAKKLKIKLAKVKNAKGYQVCVYKNKKNAKKHIKAIVTKYTTKVKYTIKSKKLKKKKKLFVGARAYNVSSNGSKVFGAWAKIKKVKVK